MEHDSTYQYVKNDVVINSIEHYPELVQQRLDTWAQLKDFDSINDACTYASSTITEWTNEAQHAITMRDLTWQAFYNATSTDWREIESSLPVLAW